MFTKLKQKVTEQSKTENTDSSLLVSPTSITSKETNGKSSLSSKKSTTATSDDNQSSDEAASVCNSHISTRVDLKEDHLGDIENTNENLNKINDNSYTQEEETLELTSEVLINNDEVTYSIKSQFSQLNQKLLSQIDDMTIEMNEKLKQNEDFHFELIKLSSKLEEYEFELDNQKSIVLNQETEITILKSEKNDLIVKNGELAKKLEILNKTPSTKSTNEEPNQNTNSLNISEFTARIEQVTSLKDTEEFKILQDQINEKNKTIKNLQQRLNDMKKTFQKEFKFQSSANNNESTTSVSESKNNKTSQIEVNNNNSSAAKLNATKKQTYLFKSISMSNNAAETIFSTQSALATPHKDMTQLSHLHDDVNFKYLKHVVLKFLTSRSYEAFHLVKALSVLLNFTNEEEQILKDTLQWKMSWFGSRPKV